MINKSQKALTERILSLSDPGRNHALAFVLEMRLFVVIDIGFTNSGQQGYAGVRAFGPSLPSTILFLPVNFLHLMHVY